MSLLMALVIFAITNYDALQWLSTFELSTYILLPLLFNMIVSTVLLAKAVFKTSHRAGWLRLYASRKSQCREDRRMR